MVARPFDGSSLAMCNVQHPNKVANRIRFYDPQSLRESYLATVEKFVTRVRTAVLKRHGDYVSVNTRDPLDAVLCGYLARRAGLLATVRRR